MVHQDVPGVRKGDSTPRRGHQLVVGNFPAAFRARCLVRGFHGGEVGESADFEHPSHDAAAGDDTHGGVAAVGARKHVQSR